MAINSKIEWTDHTLNLWHGCTKVHEGCDHCYAETLAKRWGNDIWGNDKPRKEIGSAFKELDKMQAAARAAGKIHRVFVGSMMDIFEKPMPIIDSKGNVDENQDTSTIRFHFFYRINRGDYQNLQFLLLTKRPSNISKFIFEEWKDNPPANVMIGVSVSNQKTADDLIPKLHDNWRGQKFISAEPQLDDITLENHVRKHVIYFSKKEDATVSTFSYLNWVIQGGESGHSKRPFDLMWASKMRLECSYYKVPYFFKQIDKVQPIPEEYLIREFPEFLIGRKVNFTGAKQGG